MAFFVPAPRCAGSRLLKEKHGIEPPAGTMRHASRGDVPEKILDTPPFFSRGSDRGGMLTPTNNNIPDISYCFVSQEVWPIGLYLLQ